MSVLSTMGIVVIIALTFLAHICALVTVDTT